jgi:hypothetical protein
MSQTETPDAPTQPSGQGPTPQAEPKGEPHPAIPQEDDPEIEKTEEQPS